jgi:hypothetical protein
MRHPAYDRADQWLGTVVDLVAEPDPSGLPRVVAVVVNPNWHGRLLGNVRDEVHGPWLLEQARKLLSRGMRTVAWNDVRIGDRRDPPER